MSNILNKQELSDLTEKYGQQHLLRFWDQLDAAGRQQLARQISGIDWPRLEGWIRELVLEPQAAAPFSATAPEPAPYLPVEPGSEKEAVRYWKAVENGRALMRAGKVAGFTVAGGQGTRLGFDGPKGTLPVSPLKHKTLFQMFAENIFRAQEKYDTVIPWYLMTSPLNHQQTLDFFAGHGYFGLAPENVRMFQQGMLPAVGYDGRLLLAAKDNLALSPNGHGGCLTALRDSGALADMERRGIEHVSYWQVDNPLVQMFDPLFIGLHDQTGSEMSSRSLTKTGPLEKLGNFCLFEGRTTIVEYSDLPLELAETRNPDGSLCYRAGSPAIHLFRRRFIERITGTATGMPVHRADKKVACLDDNGGLLEPGEPNAVKLEMFVFDALELAENPLILEAVREEQFGPVKNRTGVDSLETSRQLQLARACKWLQAAGIPVPLNDDDSQACEIELSNRHFLDCEDVQNAAAELSPPPANTEVYYK